MGILVNFAERTGVQFGAAEEKKCLNEREAWSKHLLLVPFIKRQLESIFGSIHYEFETRGIRALLNPDAIDICHERRPEQVLAASSNFEVSETHAIAHLYHMLTTKLAREGSYIRQVMPEGAVRCFKWDAKRKAFYVLADDMQKVQPLHFPKVS